MVSQISLGNISSQNGRTVVTGSSSGGIDTEALLNALVEAKRLPAVQLEARIEQNATRSTAYGEMQDILNRFRDAANFLRNPPGVNNETDNIFEYRKASVSASGAQAGSNYLSVTAEPGASVSNYDITVDQLATQNVKITETFALTDANTQAVGGGGPFNAGTLTLGAAGIDVALADGDTLNQVVAKINSVKSQSKVEASVIKVADGQYRLSLKTTTTGTSSNYNLGIPTSPSFLATDAIFHLDASDINGDGSYSDNPTADQAVGAPTDISGNSAVGNTGGAPTLDVDGTNGIATFAFSGTNAFTPANTNDINVAGGYNQKTFAFSFQTGADITGTQTIYEQGGTTNSMGLFVAPDPGNGGAATLFAVASVNGGQWPGNELKTLNLGVVTANTNYNVVLDFDASANPLVNDPANTFTGYVNGVQTDQVTGVAQMPAHSGAVGVGGTIGGTLLADGSNIAGDGAYFKGNIAEVILTNTSLDASQMSELNTYFDNKYVQPIATSSVFNVGFAVVEDALDSSMTIDGTTVTRQTNSIDDVIEGLTFNLLEETPPGEDLNVKIDPDTELVKSAIFNLVDSYNEFRIFAAKQMEVGDDGAPLETAVLSNSTTLRSVIARVNAEIAQVVDGITGGDPDRLADIGITFNDFPGDAETPFTRNILNVDEAALDSALLSNFEGVRRVFEFDFSSDDPDLAVFSRTNALSTSGVVLNIDQTNGIYQATYDDGSGPITIDLDGSPLSGTSGVVLTGQAGTVLEGLSLIYASSNDATVNLNMSQGIGDRLFNSLDDVLKDDQGVVTVELQNINDANDRMQKEIDRIDARIVDYRDQLIRQFSALEQAIAQSNILLQSLAAQSNARLAASGN